MLKAAFEKAQKGRRCPVCARHVSYAIYERHLHTCKIIDKDDDDVQFIGTVNMQTPEEKHLSIREPEQKILTKEAIKAESTNKWEKNEPTDSIICDEFSSKRSSFHSELKITSKRFKSVDDTIFGLDLLDAYCVLREQISALINSHTIKHGTPLSAATTISSQNLSHSPTKNRRSSSIGVNSSYTDNPSSQLLQQYSAEEHDESKSSMHELEQKNATSQNSVKNNLRALEELVEPASTSFGKQISSNFGDSRKFNTLVSLGGSKAHGDPSSWHDTTNNVINDSYIDETSMTNLETSSVNPDNQIKADERSTTVHYSLEFLWKIFLKALSFLPGTSEEENSSKLSNSDQLSASFWGAENLRILLSFFTFSVETQLFFLKIFLRGRKRLTLQKIRGKSDVEDADTNQRCTELTENGFLEEDSANLSLVESLRMLKLPDLVSLCREFKLNHAQNASDLISALCAVSQQKNVFNVSVGNFIRKKALARLGKLYSVPLEVSVLFDALFTIYAPISMDTAALSDDPYVNLHRQLLFEMLRLKTKLRYVGPNEENVRLIDIYTNYTDLEGYITAKRMEMEYFALTKQKSTAAFTALCAEAKRQLQEAHFSNKLRMDYYLRLPFHLRRFTTPSVLIRCISHQAEQLQRLRFYAEAASLLHFLVKSPEVRLFCTSTRLGQWYDRLALIYDIYLKDKSMALDVCFEGIVDKNIGDVDVLALQIRAQRLSSKNGDQLEFKLQPIEPEQVFVEGHVMSKNLGDQRVNHFYIPTLSNQQKNSERTLAENSLNEEDILTPMEFSSCSVETVALHHFRQKCGFTEGVHAEGAIWHTLFGFLCYDIIFDHNVPNVWLSTVQTHPCDLNSPDFFAHRSENFEARFAQIGADVTRECMNAYVLDTVAKKAQIQNCEISWGLFRDINHIMGFLECCSPELIVAVFRRLATNYRQFRSGFPDLTVWNPQIRKLAVIEVKGPKDRLSNKQRLWIDFFIRHGVEALLCNVTARSSRRI